MARSPRYLGHVLRNIRALFDKRPAITRAEFDAAIATARGRAGGEQRGENRRAKQPPAIGAALSYDAYVGEVVRLVDDGTALIVPGGFITPLRRTPAYVRLCDLCGMNGMDDEAGEDDFDEEGDDREEQLPQGSYEDICDIVEDALEGLYGEDLRVEGTYADHVIYAVPEGPDGANAYYAQEYALDLATDQIVWGPRTEQARETVYTPETGAPVFAADQPPAPAGHPNVINPDQATTANVPVGLSPQAEATWRAAWQEAYDACTSSGTQDFQRCKAAAQVAANAAVAGLTPQGSKNLDKARSDGVHDKGNQSASGNVAGNGNLAGVLMPKMADSISLAGSTEKPWSGAASKYSDTAAYCRASLINDNTGPASEWTQDRCHLPVKEANGDYNLNALRAAASAVAGGRTGKAPPYAAEAKRKLEPLLKRYKIGDYAESSSSKSSDAGSGIRLEAPADAQVVATMASLRLADGAALPVWQQLHKVGEWAEPHPSGVRIRLTRPMGDTLIRNFSSGVVRRDIPLDQRHGTDADGVALGWLRDVRWGAAGQGLPGGPEPDGAGSILYGRFEYNKLGTDTLGDEQYKYISPQYDLDYRDKETGRSYGPAFVAVGATNNPFLRQRSIHGQEAPAPVVLSDGLAGMQQQKGAEMTTSESPRVLELSDRVVALEAQIAAQKTEAHRVEVQHFLDGQMRLGLPPALAETFRRVMLATSPEAEGIIRLSDEPEAAPVNLYAALRSAVVQIPKVHLGPIVLEDDTRPPNGDGGPADAQVGAKVDQLYARLGIQRAPHPSGGSGLPMNGNGAH